MSGHGMRGRSMLGSHEMTSPMPSTGMRTFASAAVVWSATWRRGCARTRSSLRAAAEPASGTRSTSVPAMTSVARRTPVKPARTRIFPISPDWAPVSGSDPGGDFGVSVTRSSSDCRLATSTPSQVHTYSRASPESVTTTRWV